MEGAEHHRLQDAGAGVRQAAARSLTAFKIPIHGPADGIYMLGAGRHNLPVIEVLEKDLKTTVLSSIPAQVWATKKILHLNEPVSGYGRLLTEMP
ncbi:MAG TPA: hypothetical protein VE178_13570 [Silvibacterium sp.]|nr:hypothetical protein [Silvibacterium sp.]